MITMRFYSALLLLIMLTIGVSSSDIVAPRYSVSLDKPPAERWTEVLSHYNESLHASVSLIMQDKLFAKVRGAKKQSYPFDRGILLSIPLVRHSQWLKGSCGPMGKRGRCFQGNYMRFHPSCVHNNTKPTLAGSYSPSSFVYGRR